MTLVYLCPEDCEGCRCSIPNAAPPCGHCVDHFFEETAPWADGSWWKDADDFPEVEVWRAKPEYLANLDIHDAF